MHLTSFVHETVHFGHFNVLAHALNVKIFAAFFQTSSDRFRNSFVALLCRVVWCIYICLYRTIHATNGISSLLHTVYTIAAKFGLEFRSRISKKQMPAELRHNDLFISKVHSIYYILIAELILFHISFNLSPVFLRCTGTKRYSVIKYLKN